MPLTALGADTNLIDATTVSIEAWSTIHRVRPRAILSCRGCGEPMVAKVSSRGMRFFAHDRVSPDCPFNGESADHRWLKARLAVAVRAAGWDAQVEAEPAPDDSGGWRADVLALEPGGGRRVAFEAQLASMTADEGIERTARYARDRIETLWITVRDASWLWKIPGCKVEREESQLDDVVEPSLVVTRGCARLLREEPRPRWSVERVPLRRLVAAILADSVTSLAIGFFSDWTTQGGGERHHFHSNAVAVVSRADAEWLHERRAAEERRRAEQERREAQREATEMAHVRNRKALNDRQKRALPMVVKHLRTGLMPGEDIWLGVPASRAASDRDVTHQNALGNSKTAMGLAVWVGRDRNELLLAAVVCPVAHRIDPGLARSWDRRGTEVIAVDRAEARRLASALGWPERRVRVAGVDIAPWRSLKRLTRKRVATTDSSGRPVWVDPDTGEVVERAGDA